MARYKQVINEDGSSSFVEIQAAKRHSGIAVHGDIEPFVSPVDGSVISDRKQLREHNLRNNVVNTAEFNPEFLERKQKERERLHSGEHTPQEKLARRQEINEIINHHINKGR